MQDLLTYEKFLVGIRKLETAFRVQALSDKSLEIYYAKLKATDDKTWQQGIEEIIDEEDFFPSIHCLLKHCRQEKSFDAAGRVLKIV